jgi:hypothetical protein
VLRISAASASSIAPAHVAREGANATPKRRFSPSVFASGGRPSRKRTPARPARANVEGRANENDFGRLDGDGARRRGCYADSETDSKKATNDKGESKCVDPTHSDVFYDLHGVKLTYEQLANWMKLEQLVIGPFTDE